MKLTYIRPPIKDGATLHRASPLSITAVITLPHMSLITEKGDHLGVGSLSALLTYPMREGCDFNNNR